MSEPVRFEERSSGILFHPTSLPGPHGIGDLGPEAHRFIDFLRRAGQRWWQMLPIGPPGGGNSPYDSPSAFAGSPLLISLDVLVRDGFLESSEVRPPQALRQAGRAQYEAAARFRFPRLRLAFERFEQHRRFKKRRNQFEYFREQSKEWLVDYALFSALRAAHRNLQWTEWGRELQQRQQAALTRATNQLASEIRFFEFLQYLVDCQWSELREHAAQSGILLLGDLPMFVAHNGADVWSNQRLFHLDRAGNKTVVAGVPPDSFSKTGQLWGNALYRWSAIEATGYDWWLRRFRSTLARFDAVRLDHFIGLYHCWEVRAGARDARKGRFVRVPGAELLGRARKVLGNLPFVAEDLGLIIPEVKQLRDQFELPGMAVLQFGFGDDGAGREHEPHCYRQRTIAYTGTHDNDTFIGWLRARPAKGTSQREAAAMRRARQRLRLYVGDSDSDVHWEAIRSLLVSVADTVIFPLQDVLGLGSEARMNVPGVAAGNWAWRVKGAALGPSLADRMAELTEVSERAPPPRAGNR
jgi:4-alpha-glucanotransferase